jgi:glycosyltransferase involved in cell wall biosynthesis
MSTIHDGIDTDRASPASQRSPLTLPDGTVIAAEEPMVTFVNRAIEPYRGCHTFLRSIPALQQQAPNSRIVIVGNPSGDGYGPSPAAAGSWKEKFLNEIAGSYDPARVHFTGHLSHANYLDVLQHSWVHVYLTYPFVLSWSLLEAMSCGCAVVGSATAPVQELIQHEHNGLLTDFFDPTALADAIAHLLKERNLAKQLGKAARETILADYSLQACLPRQLALLQLVASRSLSH